MSRTEKRKFGDIGEKIASMFLVKRGFDVIERNYLKKWGEIDIIARNKNRLHFVEVKTITRNPSVSRGTGDYYRPEENIHPWKLKRISRTIQTYLLEGDYEGEWQFDAITVLIDENSKKVRVTFFENLVL